MKTKIRRYSRHTMAIILSVIMVMTCLVVGEVAVHAYGTATISYRVGSTDRTATADLSNNKGTISLNFTDATPGEPITCTLTIDSDVFGGGATLTQGDTDWLPKKSGTFTIKVTAAATVSFNILEIQPGNNPPSLRYSITDNVPDYYLVGSKWKDGSNNWTLPGDSDHTRDMTYNSFTGLYQNTLTLDAQSSGTDITYIFRVRNKGRNDWNNGSNYNYDNLSRPVTDTSSLVKSISSDSNDKNIKFTLKSDANVTFGFNEATSKITIIFTPTSCDVTTAVSPAGVGTASVTKSGGGAATGLEPGSFVDLTAVSSDATSYVFSKWQTNPSLEYADANSATTTAKVTGSAMATAQFTKTKYTVTCNEPSNGTLTVASGVDGSNKAAWGTTVTVTATPASGYALTSVTAVDASSGAVTVTDNATFTMPKSNVTVTATFHQLNNYSVTYGDDDNGYVSVGYQYSDTQDTITQSITNGATDVVEGSAVNFCAIPKPGYKFDGWYTAASGGTSISTTQDETVTINGAVTRYAHFSALDYKPEANKIKLLISKSAVDTGTNHSAGNKNVHYWGAINGDVTISTDTFYTNVNGATTAADNFYLVTLDCSSDNKVSCLVNTANGDYTTQTKNFDDLSKGNTYIINWSGDGKTGGKCVAYSLPTAVYPITLNVTNAEMGSDTHVKAYATAGTEVTVNATVTDETNNKVTVKENDVVKDNKKFTMPSDRSAAVDVTYASKELRTITLPEVEGGTVTATAGGKQIPDGGTVLEGTEVTFKATPDNGHTFTKWTINGTDYNTATKVYTVNADTTATVTFADKVYEVWWPNNDSGTGGTKYCGMTKQPNGTYVSDEIMGKNYHFTIKCVTDDKFSHAGASGDDGWYINALDSTVSEKANARWYSGIPNKKERYKNTTGSEGYVVYDPNAANKNDNNDEFSHYKGMIWLTTNSGDGTYPTIVYLKDGTVRSGYNTTAMNGVTTLESTGTTDGLTATDLTNYGSKTVNSETEYYVKRVIIPYSKLEKGVTLHIKTQTIDNQLDPSNADKGNAKDYYVKGFDVNGGLTKAVIDQEFNDNDLKDEKAEYPDRAKIHGTVEGTDTGFAWNDFTLELNVDNTPGVVEVTPIYFYRSTKSSDTVRFYAQDFVGDVQKAWRGSLAVYPYIENIYDPYGNYPGQLMVNEGGRYMMDIPATYTYTDDNGTAEDTTDDKRVTINLQGLTMNNFIWDDVHHDIFFPDIHNDHKSDANYQTYDYNEFEIINHIFQRDGLDEDIIFSFKYKGQADPENSNLGSKVNGTVYKPIYFRDNETIYSDATKVDAHGDRSYGGDSYHAYDYRALKPELSKADLADSRYKFEDLTDFYHNKVDIMGNLCEDDPDKADYNPIHIISVGYDYNDVGKYATAWAYYMPADASNNPVWTGDFDHYRLFEVMGGQGITGDDKFGSESYLIDPNFSDRIIAKYTNQAGTAKILDCEHVPCKITYEYEIKQDVSNLKKYIDPDPSDEKGTNMAYRSDGRWYFSNSDSLITAHTAIAVVDASGSVYTRDYYQDDNIDYTKGGYNKTLNVGRTTGIKAYFTNDGTETVEGREISNTAGTTECNSISDGEHTYDMTTIGDPSGEYEFVGWYLFNGTNYILASTEQTYSQEAKTNDVFVAVYRVVPSGTLNITHNLHPESTGKAACYATVKVKDKDDTVKYNSGRTDDQISVGPTYIKSNSDYNIEITLETELDQFASFENFYNYANTLYSSLVEGGDILGLGATITIDTSSAVKTATITFPIKALFDQNDDQTTKAIPLFSKVMLPDYRYELNYTYPSYVSKYGTQGYTEKGTFTQKQLDTYMEFVGANLKFKTTGSLKSDFLNNNAPYEKNFKENISWNVSGTETYDSNSKTMSITIPAIIVNKPINLTFEFPYAHANEAGKFAATETESKVNANFESGHFVYDNTPVVDNKPKFNSDTQKFELFTFSENKSISTVANSDLLYAPSIIWNGDTPYYFRYWSVKAEGGKNNETKEYTRCYNYYFDYVIFQDSVIRPIYTVLGEGESASSVTPYSELEKDNMGVQISFIENSRNQYNNGNDHTKGSAPKYDTSADLIYSDFLLSFNSVIKEDGTAIRLDKQPDDAYKAGLIIERVGALDVDESGNKIIKTEAEYQSQYGINRAEIVSKGKETLNTVLEKVVKGTYDSSTDGKGYLKSEIDANELDNKNRINFYYNLPNRKKDSTDNNVLSDFLKNRDNIYRAYAYIRKNDNTEYHISEVPVYFTIYEIASIENGGKG